MLMDLILKQQSSNYNSTVSRRKLVYLFIFLSVLTRQQCLLRHKLQVSGPFPLVRTKHTNKPFPISYSKPLGIWRTVYLAPSWLCSWLGFLGLSESYMICVDSFVFLRLVRAHNWACWKFQAIFSFCSMKNVSKVYVLNYFFTLVPT